MTEPFTDLNEAELDELIQRVTEAVDHHLSLSIDDMRRLLNALVMLVQLQERMSEHDITVHKLRKLAGLVSASEQFKDIIPEAAKPPRQRHRSAPPEKPPLEPVIHQRCHHRIEGLEKGQRCPDCEKGKLYKYDPALVLRISGQTPLTSVQHSLERLRCNTCGVYFTAELPEEVKRGRRDRSTIRLQCAGLDGFESVLCRTAFLSPTYVTATVRISGECLERL